MPTENKLKSKIKALQHLMGSDERASGHFEMPSLLEEVPSYNSTESSPGRAIIQDGELGEVLNEIAQEQFRGQQAFDTVRRKYLKSLSDHTGRNVIAYYSGWQSKGGIFGTEIRDEDRDGFMRAVHQLNFSLGLDLILHTPGGSIAATQSIVLYLKEKFGENIQYARV